VLVGGGFDGHLVILRQAVPRSWQILNVNSGSKKDAGAVELSETFSAKLGMFKSREKKVGEPCLQATADC